MPLPDAAFDPQQWSGFLSTETQASATLTGLLFVAISINLSRIVAEPFLIPRAVKALVTLAGIILAGSLCLVPGQMGPLLGAELAALGAVIWFTIAVQQRRASKGNPYVTAKQRLAHELLTHLSALPLVVCGVSLIAIQGGGLYWLVVAVIASLVAVLLDAWVLLIEILR